jgi:hypothetical protein
MSKEIVKISTNNLFVPAINAELKMSLQDVDSLRLACNNAIQVAKELESRQKMIQIEVTENYKEEQFDNSYTALGSQWRDTYGKPINSLSDNLRKEPYSKWVDKKRIIGTFLVNLDDVTESITTTIIDKLVSAHNAQVAGLQTTLDAKDKSLKLSYEAADKLRDDITDLKGSVNAKTSIISDLQKQVYDLEDEVKELNKKEVKAERTQKVLDRVSVQQTELRLAYNKLLVKKTFWGWLTSMFGYIPKEKTDE